MVQYTNTIADPRIDAHFMDNLECTRGHISLTYHYLVKTDGTIETGRDVMTVSIRSRKHWIRATQIMIGVVGGLDFDTGKASTTMTPEQEASVEWLMQSVTDALGIHLEVNSYVDLSADQLDQHHQGETAADEADEAYQLELDRAEAGAIADAG